MRGVQEGGREGFQNGVEGRGGGGKGGGQEGLGRDLEGRVRGIEESTLR